MPVKPGRVTLKKALRCSLVHARLYPIANAGKGTEGSLFRKPEGFLKRGKLLAQRLKLSGRSLRRIVQPQRKPLPLADGSHTLHSCPLISRLLY